jgi:RHH-type rel operon transcriptional repressor/antitoxin RelB
MISIQIDPETERRLAALAKLTGRSEDSYARELIEEHIDDLEDRYVAESRLNGRRAPITSEKVRLLPSVLHGLGQAEAPAPHGHNR